MRIKYWASRLNWRLLDIDDSGKVTGQYVIQFENGSDMRIHFKGFIGYDGDGFNILVINELNW